MNYTITPLPKDKWKGFPIPIEYNTAEYYDFQQSADGFDIHISKKPNIGGAPHTQEAADFPDMLYADYREGAYAWGVILDGVLIGVIETMPEDWNNRLRVTELWVDERYRGLGIGKALIDVAKEQAVLEHRRAIVLEAQTNNVNGVDFYRHMGFSLIGFDNCSYSNRDIENREVRLELGYIVRRKPLDRSKIVIRPETPDDYRATELMTQRAFWNLHNEGCNEHLLVRNLRKSPDYLPALSRVAVYNGEIIGCIMYSKARIECDCKVTDIVSFGPLCAAPEWQNCGVCSILLEETLSLAAKAGYPAAVIFGESGYYPKHGFRKTDAFGITTPDGGYCDALMGIELSPHSLDGISGKFCESSVYFDLPDEETEKLNAQFPPLTKQKFPHQWN